MSLLDRLIIVGLFVALLVVSAVSSLIVLPVMIFEMASKSFRKK